MKMNIKKKELENMLNIIENVMYYDYNKIDLELENNVTKLKILEELNEMRDLIREKLNKESIALCV